MINRTNPPTTTRTTNDDEDEDDSDEEDEDGDDNEEIEDINLADYLEDESLDAALDLKEHLSGRSPLDNLEPRIQQAILLLMEDYDADLIAEVIAELCSDRFRCQNQQALPLSL